MGQYLNMSNFKKLIQEQNVKLAYDLAEKAQIDISNYNISEVMMGIEIEKEHDNMDPKKDVVKDPVDLLKIALAHLDENPRYYSRLLYAGLQV